MGVFPKGARVCFIGDSITHNNGYVSFIFEFYRQRGVRVFNCGISGATAGEHIALLEDTLSYQPTHAVITLGVNDSKYTLLAKECSAEREARLSAAFEAYQSNVSAMCRRLREAGVEVILCTPPPYDEFSVSSIPALQGGSMLLQGYAEFIREYGQQNGIAVCDYNRYLAEVVRREIIFSDDRVHPNDLGQFHMAKCFLAFQGEKIGPFAPLPPEMSAWRTAVKRLRDIYAAEYLLLHDFTLDCERGSEKVRAYLENTPDAPEIFKYYAKQYLLYKPIQKQVKDEMLLLTTEVTNGKFNG